MAKRASKHLRAPRPLATGGFAQLEHRGQQEWMVQAMPSDAAGKTYLCPGCHQQIAPGVAHTVVWPRLAGIGSASAVEERRHWHTACWQRVR